MAIYNNILVNYQNSITGNKYLYLLKTCICDNHVCVITLLGRPGGNCVRMSLTNSLSSERERAPPRIDNKVFA